MQRGVPACLTLARASGSQRGLCAPSSPLSRPLSLINSSPNSVVNMNAGSRPQLLVTLPVSIAVSSSVKRGC